MHFHPMFMRRAIFGAVAVAMTAITFGALVVAPATMSANDADIRLRAASNATVLASTRAVAGATVNAGATHAARMGSVPCSEAAPIRPYRMPVD